MKEIKVSVGQHVLERETIAEMGETGHAFGEHLHFEIRNVRYDKFWDRYENREWIHAVDPDKFYLEREAS